MLPPRNTAAIHTAGKRKFKLEKWKVAAPVIQAETEVAVATLHEEVKAGRMDVGAGIESAMNRRDRVMIDICSDTKSPRANGGTQTDDTSRS